MVKKKRKKRKKENQNEGIKVDLALKGTNMPYIDSCWPRNLEMAHAIKTGAN